MGRPHAEGERRAPAPPQRIRSALKTPPLARSLAPSRSRQLRNRTMGPHEYFVGFHHKISLGNWQHKRRGLPGNRRCNLSHIISPVTWQQQRACWIGICNNAPKLTEFSFALSLQTRQLLFWPWIYLIIAPPAADSAVAGCWQPSNERAKELASERGSTKTPTQPSPSPPSLPPRIPHCGPERLPRCLHSGAMVWQKCDKFGL